jgi:nucleotide-binding universal stress UspA family protein
MYDKILVAIDQSPVAERVLAAARDLARLSGGEVRVLHLREREIMGGRGGVLDYETGDEARATANQAVRALAERGSKRAGMHGIRRSGTPPGKSSGKPRSSVPGSSSWAPGATVIWPG